MTTCSAIIVTHNSIGALPQLLDALSQVTDEIVIVDNDSRSRGLEQLTESNSTIRLYVRKTNDGFAVAANEGIARASGDLILLINPDIAISVDNLKALAEALRRHPNGIIGPLVRLQDGSIQKTRSGWPSLWNLIGEQLLIPERATPGKFPARLWSRWRAYDREEPGGPLSGCCLMFSREVWNRVGPFDERYFLYWEEIDWQLRAREAGIESWLIPDAVVTHERAGSSSVYDPRRAEMFYSSYRAFIGKWFPRPTRYAAMAIAYLGQVTRWGMWSLAARLGRSESPARRDFHRQALRTLRSPAQQ